VPTASTVPNFITALLSAMQTALPGVQVSPAWPGPDVTDEETLFVGSEVESWDVEIPTMKAGRKQRQETYTVTLEAWVAKPGLLRSESANAARTRAIEIIDAVDSFLADDPQLTPSVLWARMDGRGATLVPFDKGWSCQATASISVAARLT
jgi:hypothetical protein